MSRGRLYALCEATAEAAWLAAAVVVLLLGLPYGELGLESARWLVLRPLAALAVGAAVAAALAARGGRLPERPRHLRSPVAVAALALAAALTVATLLSIAPARAFHGAPPRLAGLASLLAPLALLVVAAPRLAAAAARERLLSALVAAGGALAVWALAARAGLDPLAWRDLAAPRVSGPQANPLFLGAALALLVPIALARAIAAGRRGARASALAAWAVAALQLAAALAAGARGPLLGLAGGLGLAALAAALRAGRRRLALAVVAGVLAVGLAVPLLAPGPGGAAEKLGRAFDLERGTGAQRLRLWRGTWDLLAAEPARLASGYGPETLALVLPPHLPEETPGLFYRPDLYHDRAHNLLLDAAASAGLPGALACLALLVAALGRAFAEAGFAGAERRLALASAAAALALGALALALGGPPFLAAAIGVAPVLAALGVVARGGSAAAGRAWWPLGVAAALAASLIESQVGLRTAATETLVALLAALVAGPWLASAPAARQAPPAASGLGRAGAPLVALVTATAVASLWTPPQVGVASAPGRALALILLAAAAAALVAERPLRALAAGLGFTVPYLLAHGAALAAGAPQTALVTIYLVALAIAVAWLASRVRPGAGAAAKERSGAPAALAAGLLLVVPAALVGTASLARFAAGVALADARAALDSGRFAAAEAGFAAAAERAPELVAPALGAARARGRRAAALADPLERDRAFGEALAALELDAARFRDPAAFDFETGALLARWAESSGDPDARAARFRSAVERLARAASADPTSAPIARTLGLALLGLERIDEAIAALERATRAAPRSLEGHLLHARALLAGGEIESARRAARTALDLDAGRARTLVLGFAAARPDDVGVQLDAALVLALAGDEAAARTTLARARSLASPADRPWVERVTAALAPGG